MQALRRLLFCQNLFLQPCHMAALLVFLVLGVIIRNNTQRVRFAKNNKTSCGMATGAKIVPLHQKEIVYCCYNSLVLPREKI